MPTARTFRILMLRVGSTIWDDAGRLCGAADIPLSEAGLRDCRHDAADTAEGLDLILTGPDEASMQTARIHADRAGGRVRVCDGLGGMRLGLWEGLRLCEFTERYPSASKLWREEPERIIAPEGESLFEVEHRVLQSLAKALDRARPGVSRVGLVLRPIAMGLVCCAIDRRPAGDLWDVLGVRPTLKKTDASGEARRGDQHPGDQKGHHGGEHAAEAKGETHHPASSPSPKSASPKPLVRRWIELTRADLGEMRTRSEQAAAHLQAV